VVVVRAQGTTLVIRGTWTAGGLPDSAITSLSTGATHRLKGTVVRDSFWVTRPAAGTVLAGTFCVRTKKAGWTNSAKVCKAWTWKELSPPVVPPPITDTLALTVTGFSIKPSTVALLLGQTQQFCGFVLFADGQVVPFTNQRGIPYCGAQYVTWPPAQRNPSAAQVALVDAMALSFLYRNGRILVTGL
jgi:hypothetical protein